MRKLFIITVILTAAGVSSSVFCGVFKYDSHGRRDPFVPLIGVDKTATAGLSDITSIEDAKLEGIATDARGMRTAIINGEMVNENFKSGEVQIKKIGRDFVTMKIGGKDYKLSLPEEGGLKK